MAIEYSFTTKWETTAPVADAWEAIRNSLDWPLWWKSFVSVTETKGGDDRGIGSIRTYTLKSPTGYKLSFDMLLTDRVDHKLLSGKATGELAGTGTWHFNVRDNKTYIECKWNVATTKAWMNMLAFILRPAFEYNHRMVMKKGAKYLEGKLGMPVNDIS
ncbi:MAG: polyketide cyclase [Flavipsychrobacter sp.]|nr:polyketide cyclase [Flavipsychrobacter sp.]